MNDGRESHSSSDAEKVKPINFNLKNFQFYF
jgi:hypothetical protein